MMTIHSIGDHIWDQVWGDDMKRDIQDFLVEAMGGCAHNWGRQINPICSKCKATASNTPRQVDFTSEEGFFVLYRWIRLQPWFEDFLYRYWSCPQGRNVFPYHYIDHPELFPEQVFKFLTGVYPSFYLKWKAAGLYDIKKDQDND